MDKKFSQKTAKGSLDQDGLAIEFDVREDEEQQVKYEQTVDLLLAAGYFRARIKTLSPFDKVVGGMTWCITTCSYDIDVDLLFQENSTIGQKIALTEKIVAVLPQMKCPHRIEPHQIQGLDFIHIFPVVQWLVKKAIETREAIGDYVRAYAIAQFNRQFEMPQDVAHRKTTEKMIDTISQVKSTYAPRRKFKRHEQLKSNEPHVRVQSTLVEYGQQHYSSQQNKAEKKESSTDAEGSASEVIDEHLSELISGMVTTKSRLAAGTIGSIVGEQSEQILQMSRDFAEKKLQLEQAEKLGVLGGVKHQERIKSALEKQVAQEQARLAEVKEAHQSVQSSYQETMNQLQQVRKHAEHLEEDTKNLDAMETAENKDILDTLRQLVALNETLKKQEQLFKTQCKEELSRLQADIETVKKEGGIESEEDQERKRQVTEQHELDKQRLQKIRILMGRKNREISTLQRKLDEVPSRAELSQYQKRFVELYEQVAATHKETKQFYTMYNALDDTKLYLEKEIGLLNSICDTYPQAMMSPASKEEFLKQLENIVAGVKNNKAKLDKKFQDEKLRRDQLNDQHLDLVEKERLYYKTIRDFQEECRKNEILTARLEQQTR